MQRITLEELGRLKDEGLLHQLAYYCEYCKKISYGTEEEAKQAGRKMRADGKGKTYSYECPKGKGWHLTSNPRFRKKR